jgi:hypothetical protein
MNDDSTRADEAIATLRAALAEQAATLAADERRLGDGLDAYLDRTRPA